MRRAVPLAAVFALAAIGLAAALGGGDQGGASFGTVRPAPDASPGPAGAVAVSVGDQLAALRRALAIRPEQEVAWRRYAATMLDLDRESRALERRVGRQEAEADTAERGRHALTLSAALVELQDSVSADQFARARRESDALSAAVICKAVPRG